MKFFFQCLGFYIVLAAILIILDQVLFEHALGGSFLWGQVISLVATIIFGWYMETHVHHTYSIGD